MTDKKPQRRDIPERDASEHAMHATAGSTDADSKRVRAVIMAAMAGRSDLKICGGADNDKTRNAAE